MFRTIRRSLLATTLATSLVAGAAGAVVTSVAPRAAADAPASTATGFLQAKHAKVRALLATPASPERDKKVDAELVQLLDYGEMAKVALGDGCTKTAECDQFKNRTKAELDEFTGLLRQLIEKNYKKRLDQTKSYEISYKGEEPKGTDTLVKTEAKNLKDKREAPVLIDYVVRKQGSGFIVVDLIPEGSSMAKTYNKEFIKVIKKNGWPELIKKMKDKLAKS